MRQSTIAAFAYILAPQDRSEFSELNRDQENIDAIFQSENSSLEQVDPKVLSESQRFLLAAYLTMYAVRAGSATPLDRVPAALNRLQVSTKYFNHVKNAFASLNRELVEQWGSPLEMVFTPPDEMIRFATLLVSFGLSHGEYKYRRIVENLDPKEYEHEMDRLFLDALKKTRGFETLVRLFFKHGVERVYAIQYTGSNLQINQQQLPQIYEIISESCKVLNLPTLPDAYLEQGFINAFTIGSEKPLLVFSSGCFGLLDYAEQTFITGHEVGHIKSGHCLYSMIANLITSGVIEPLIGALNVISVGLSAALLTGIQVALLNWVRTSELTADRAGLLCCQDIDAALRCMMKLAGMSPMFYSSMNIEAFKQQARDFRELDFSTRDKIIKVFSILGATHPWTVMRAHELLKWYESGEYQRVLDRASATKTQATTIETDGQHGAAILASKVDENDSIRPKFCSECGAPHVPDTRFCTQCGNKLG